jgi:sialate O-acetylesterase
VQERWDKIVADYPAAKEKFDRALAEWEEKKKAAEQAGQEFSQPKPKAPDGGPKSRGVSGAYNAMIHPLAPYTVRAALWYQGEANWKYPGEYGRLLRALMKDWRAKWQDADLPFVIVQLPAYGGDGNVCWPYIREGQAAAVPALPPAGLLVTVDLGEPKEIHPPNKQVFADRLTRTVRRTVFGEDIDDKGPIILSATPEGAAMRVKVEEKGKIVLRDQPPVLGAFELAGEDRVFHPAAVRLEGNDLVVSSPAVPAPVALRYAWREFPKPCLFDDQGLPAAPFRTDDWPPKK